MYEFAEHFLLYRSGSAGRAKALPYGDDRPVRFFCRRRRLVGYSMPSA